MEGKRETMKTSGGLAELLHKHSGLVVFYPGHDLPIQSMPGAARCSITLKNPTLGRILFKIKSSAIVGAVTCKPASVGLILPGQSFTVDLHFPQAREAMSYELLVLAEPFVSILGDTNPPPVLAWKLLQASGAPLRLKFNVEAFPEGTKRVACSHQLLLLISVIAAACAVAIWLFTS